MTCLRLPSSRHPDPWWKACVDLPDRALTTLTAVTATSTSASATGRPSARRFLMCLPPSLTLTRGTYAFQRRIESGIRLRTGDSLGAGEAHSLVHLLERRRRSGASLLRALGEQALELGGVAAQVVVAGQDRVEQCDHGLGDVRLEGAVAAAAVASLELPDRLAGGHGHE